MTTRLTDIRPSPDAFAAVMATGILSIGANNHKYTLTSHVLGVLATAGLVILIALVLVTAGRERGIAFWDLTDPDVTLRLFTFVAACAVLDSRLEHHQVAVRILGAIAFSAWLVLSVLTAHNMSRRSWTALRDRVHGAWELASVGTSGLALVTAQAADSTGNPAWLAISVPTWGAAICVYCLMTWLIMWRTVAERLDRDGFEPDTWILMGALAIATLAGDNIYAAGPHWLAGGVRAITVVTWVLATLWIPPLIYFVLHHINQRPALLEFRGVWWALVFPLGMYSAATFAMASEVGVRKLQTVSLMFFWNAIAAWLVVVIAGVLRTLRFWRARVR